MLTISKFSRSAGLSLIELMIALAINGVLFTALMAVFIANINHYHQSLNNSRLNQELQTALGIMAADISRAGYWGNAHNDIGTHQNNNPFQASGADVTVSGSNDCILFTYDYNGNGTLPTIASGNEDERYGFRVNNQTLQARPPGATFSCSAPSSDWENMTNPNVIHITNLGFTLTTTSITTGPGTKGIALRSVDITLTGQLANDATVTKTLTQHVRIRNDKFIP